MLILFISYEFAFFFCSNNPRHVRVWEKILKDLNFEERSGRKATKQFFEKHICGAPNKKIIEEIFDPEIFHEFKGKDSIKKFDLKKEKKFRDLFKEKNDWQSIAGVDKLFESFDRDGVLHAVVTNAPMLNASAMLNGIRLAKRFIDSKNLFIADECKVGKQ